MKFGVATMPRSVNATVDTARAAAELGFDLFGVGEGPFLHHDTYVTVTACLLGADRIPVGPYVSNPVVRHWSTHAATARALDELAPGRFFLGLATGDGAVRSVGLAPMRWAELAETVAQIRERGGSMPVHCTVSGPKGAEVAGTFADAVVVATGADIPAVRELGARARGDGTRGVEVWTMIPTLVVDDDDDVAAAREAMRIAAYSTAHFAFAGTFEAKNVPEEYQARIRAGLAPYDYNFHGVASAENPNPHAFDHDPEVGDYLVDRMMLVGTARDIRGRVEQLGAESRLDGFSFPTSSADAARRLAVALTGLGSVRA